MTGPAIGLAVREENRSLLELTEVRAAEITLERADDPLRLAPYIDRDSLDYVSVHCLKMSLASPDPPPEHYLSFLADVASECSADAISDHLGFTRDHARGGEIGHFAPPPFSEAARDVVCRNVEIIQRKFPDRPFFLENITYQFLFKGTMTEAEFFQSVLKSTGCGWLLDVTNLYANAVNFRFDPLEFLDVVIPAASRLQVHLAGGYFDPRNGLYVDSHSQPIPEAVWQLYEFAVARAGSRLEAVFIERDQSFPDDDEWFQELNQARNLALRSGVGHERAR